MMKSADIRDLFLNYFASKEHAIVPSSSLVPGNDPTLLFTNAGMVQFKDVFLGADQRSYNRAVTSQRCVRAGGKHNDLENVGYTARHHTFFEMLGNFSFGEYFKRDAIGFAWQFLTEELGLSQDRLWVTVHVSDDEAADIWINEIGVDPARLSRLDEDNFWQMGDTGPCGPCTEIFWDHGEHIPGGPPGSPDDHLDRYIEIWNLVFMQFERDASGTMTPLPKPSIDTGMGLERVAAVMQGVHSNYDIDLFQHLIKAASAVTGCKDLQDNSLKVIADHIRSCAFLIVDGVKPSNEGRGYVLRRIIRRALRHGHNLGANGNFFYKLTASLGEIMGDAYPELLKMHQVISDTIKKEEEQFARTLDIGMGVLKAALADLSGTELSGELVFQLYDTFGFPTDLTNDVAREKGYTLDIAGYEKCMEEQRSRARSASQFSVDYTDGIRVEGSTEFCGYESLESNSNILGLFTQGKAAESAGEDAEIALVLDKTVFYAESGGQVGDSGFLKKGSAKIEITDCRKVGNHHVHIGRVLSGEFRLGDTVDAFVDHSVRQATALNHSATHLLHEALRQVLGEHVEQKGSLVDSQRLRFDFSHGESVSNEQIRRVEHIINREILKNTAVATQVMSMDEAKAKGAVALFGEKYGDQVRVVTLGGEYSIELCGGTHVSRSGDIGAIRITAESSVASGIRRIEGVTGMKAVGFCDDQQDELGDILSILRSGRQGLKDKAQSIVDDNRRLQKEIESLKDKLASTAGNDLMSGLQDIGGISVLSTIVEGADAKSLRGIADQVRSKMQRGVFMLAAVEGEKAALVAGVTQNLTDDIKAGELLKFVTDQVGGKGGGRPDLAQGATGDVSQLPSVLQSVYQWVAEKSE
ncbi:MAG: alanine--tRNA ligase [Proteobacteria bacterium]|jgi:alanyl-tRNA synthetase|uniref:Alanine--tRNA ligase n=1 Tax=SAR92 bacterium BACL26 MAG-121220-bin70 TaxID=1655626 RepID=A0A0R2U809_9GAMM|nr:MAG: alanine--tRNA ligase [SAR92 bacterium BACL26 MAG-121220-bin70]MDA0796399.1 alanine--tRNA ligase [Pseudomonadota bacterium]MDA1352255.1 alanine--tRNA ligase [Pseudomonadota bacterium]|tara:strand:- start:1243 stop:3843 length:2601 start_codon:yes stop_codon:yes gene_type:complete